MLELIRKAQHFSKDGNISLVKNLVSGKWGTAYEVDGMLDKARRKMLAKNPIMPNAADIVNWNLYDTYSVAAGASVGASFSFYTSPIGGTKTKMHTNLEQVQRLPDPLWMNVIAMGFQFGPEVITTDIINVVNNYFVEFWVGGKVYVEGRFEMFPSGTGLSGSTTNTASSVVTLGQANWNNIFDLRLPAGIGLGGGQMSDGLTGVTILQGQQFKITCTAPGGAQTATAAAAGGAGVRVISNLYGILSRGVQ